MVPLPQQLALITGYVTRLFNTFSTPDLIFHNLLHTEKVVSRADEIASHYSITEKDHFVLITAAWFHDCGHLFGPMHGHEERSVLVMKEYMRSTEIEQEMIIAIGECVLATKMPANPTTLVAAILCDADLYHLGTEEFLVTDKLVKAEFELRGKWLPANHLERTLTMLQNHHYFTDYCQSILDAGKRKNIEFIQGLIRNEEDRQVG